jgi:WD40 repeat protein
VYASQNQCEQIFTQLSGPRDAHSNRFRVENNFAFATDIGADFVADLGNNSKISTQLTQTLLKEYADLSIATNLALKDGDQSLAATLFRAQRTKYLELKRLGIIGTTLYQQISSSSTKDQLELEQLNHERLELEAKAQKIEQVYLPWMNYLRIENDTRPSLPILNVNFSSDDQSILLGGRTTTAKIFDSGSGQLLRTIEDKTQHFYIFRHDGRQAFAIKNGQIDLIDLGSRINPQTNPNPNPNNVQDTSAGTNSNLKLNASFNVKEPRKRIKSTWYDTGTLDQIIYSPDATKLALVQSYFLTGVAIKLIDSQSGRLLARIKYSFPNSVFVQFSPNGELIAVASGESFFPKLNDPKIYFFNSRTGLPVGTLPGHYDPINNMNFSPDGTQLITNAAHAAVRVWDITSIHVANKHLKLKLDRKSPLRVNFQALWPFAAGSGGYFGRPKMAISEATFIELNDNSGPKVTAAEFSPDGKLALIMKAAGQGELGSGQLWNAQTGEIVLNLEAPVHQETILDPIFSHDGRLIGAIHGANQILLWSSKTGKIINSFNNPGRRIEVFKFSNDDKKILTITMDNTIRIWKQTEI